MALYPISVDTVNECSKNASCKYSVDLYKLLKKRCEFLKFFSRLRKHCWKFHKRNIAEDEVGDNFYNNLGHTSPTGPI